MLNPFKRAINPLINSLGRRKIERHFSAPQIVIGGCGRSGTTLLVAILDAHPHIYSLPDEIGNFLQWDQRLDPRDGKVKKVPRRMDRLYRYILLRRIPSAATRYCLKKPKNVVHFKKILNYYQEEVRLIHMIRDGRDVLTSRHPEDPQAYWIPIERWVEDVKAGLAVKDHPRVLTLKYEALILDFEATLTRICDFLEEPLVPQLRAWYDHTRVRRNRAWFSSLQQLHSNSIGRWRKKEHAARIEKVMQNNTVVALLQELDYINN